MMEIKTIFKIFLLSAALTFNAVFVNGQDVKDEFSWDDVIDAIIQVESRGDPNAYNPNGDCAGIMQITKICVTEANNILKEKGLKKRFSFSDRFNEAKSREIFLLIQEKYNKEHDLVKACRIWNEGPSYNRKIKTTEYVMKVMEKMK